MSSRTVHRYMLMTLSSLSPRCRRISTVCIKSYSSSRASLGLLPTPIPCSDNMVATVQQIFPCMVSPFPCKYLGIPLFIMRLRRAEEQPLVDSIAARIPTWKSGLLTHAGRVLLTKVTLSAILVHISIACYLSAWAVNQIDKRRRAFLWAGTESVSGGKCKVAWTVVCRPTCLGGLGVIDLRYFGFALRLRWEWLRRSQPERCWARLPCKAERNVEAMCAVSLSVVLGDGGSARMWMDSWAPVGPLRLYVPDLFAAVSRTGKQRTVKEALHHNRWARSPRRYFASTSGCGDGRAR